MRLSRPGAIRVVVRYDSRLFAAADGAVVAHGDHYEFCPTDVSEQRPPAQSTVSYAVPDLSDGDSAPLLCVGVPLTVRVAYPAENIDAPLPIQVTILDEAGAELASVEWAAAESPAGAPAWGVELAATWASIGDTAIPGVPTATRARSAARVSAPPPSPPAPSSPSISTRGWSPRAA